jgi:RNA polymerase sigma-70 factor, ECF subfamily
MNEVGNGRTADGETINCIIHIDILYRYALSLTRNTAEAEDLVQETYVRALAAVRRSKSMSNVRAWLFKILKNVWINQLRKLGNGRNIIRVDTYEEIANTVIETAKDPHTVYVDKVEQEKVQKAIKMLPAAYRRIILLREYDELSYREIAEILACPPGTVMSQLARARMQLRILLSNQAKASNDDSHT